MLYDLFFLFVQLWTNIMNDMRISLSVQGRNAVPGNGTGLLRGWLQPHGRVTVGNRLAGRPHIRLFTHFNINSILAVIYLHFNIYGIFATATNGDKTIAALSRWYVGIKWNRKK